LAATTALRSNSNIKIIFEVILALGNYMNADSFRGGAYGFTIETLSKVRFKLKNERKKV